MAMATPISRLFFKAARRSPRRSVEDLARRNPRAARSGGAREVGLPLHRLPLERTADTHAAVADGVVGKGFD
jgi:NADPH2:quinone reductase